MSFWSPVLRVAACVLTLALSSCGGGGGTHSASSSQDGYATHTISSASTNFSYEVRVWLPSSYATSTAAFRTIYALDCEYRFETLKGALQTTGTQAILVNVCDGSTNRRFVDFTLPGARSFYRFLTTELIPFVESRYRADPAARVLSGHSLSGQFVMYALFFEDPSNRFFKSVISEECSCWYDAGGRPSLALPEAWELEQSMYEATRILPVNLVLAGDRLGNYQQVRLLQDTLDARHYHSLRMVHYEYSFGHSSMDGPSFIDALTFLAANP